MQLARTRIGPFVPLTGLLFTVLLFQSAAPLAAQSPIVMIRSGLTVLPVFFVPTDDSPPTQLEQTTLMRHLYWAQSRYLEMLGGRTTFRIATDRPVIYQATYATNYYQLQPEGGAPAFVDELLRANNLTRINCPYSLLIVFRNSKIHFPSASGGRPINGWFNEGGGVAMFSSQDLAGFGFQSTLRHELGHSFDLVHVDAYGYDMSSNASIMSYNTAQWTNYFQDSPTPGILIPEDLRSLSGNKLAFPSLTFTTADVPKGYSIYPTTYILPPMNLPNQPSYSNWDQFLSGDTVTQTVREGETAVFVASITTGVQPLSYQWQLRNVNVSGATGSALVINKALAADAGEYTVLVRTSSANLSSNKGILVVNPVIAPSSALVSPAAATVGQTGGEGTVDVRVTPSNASWTAVSSADWLTIPSGTKGTGTWTLMYSVAPNPSSSGRSAQISLAGATFTVTQGQPSAPPSPAVTSLSPASLKQGRTTDLIIAGQNLGGAQLSITPVSGITITGVQSAPNSIAATFTVGPDTAPGTFALTISTANGSAAINLFVVADPSLPLITSVLNGASYLPALAPNTWLSVFGNNLGTQESAQTASTTTLGGATVSVCGTLAVLNYNSGAGQINALMPSGSAGRATCPMVVTVNGTRSPTMTVSISSQALGIFQFTSGALRLPVATHADYSVVGPPATGLSAAQGGETIVLWCTGWNQGAPTPAITIGGASVRVTYFGPSGATAGLCQINIAVPTGLPSGGNNLLVGDLGPYSLWTN